MDGLHDYEGTKKELQLAARVLVHGGVIVCDDYNKDWPDNVRAINEFIQETPKFKPVFSLGNKFIITNAPKMYMRKLAVLDGGRTQTAARHHASWPLACLTEGSKCKSGSGTPSKPYKC